MKTRSEWKVRVRSFSRIFTRARDGGVAMMFALAMPPMTMMAVCGLDIHRASSVRQSLQDALDAATLAAARSDETTDAGIREVGLRVLRANLAQFPHVTLNEHINSTNFDLNADGSVTSFARVSVDTLVAGAFLGDELDVNVDSMVFRSNNRVEVALVIDNTGSMNSYARIQAARTAARDLVERLAAADERSVEEGAVRISLVPFSMTVRVNPGFGTQNNRTSATALGWLSRSTSHTGSTGTTGLFSTGVDRFQVLDTLRIGWGGCVESRPYPYDVQDTAPSSGNQATMFVPYFSPDTPDSDAFNSADSTTRNLWQNYDRYNDWINESTNIASLLSGITSSNRLTRLTTAWSTITKDSAKYARANLRSGIGTDLGPNRGCKLEPVVRLTDDFDNVLDSIDDMVADGNTNIPMGLMWGWHTLSPRAPFADGRAYGEEQLQKIIILLTDGDNVNSEAGNPDDSTYSGAGLIWQLRLGSSIGVGSSGTARRNAMDERLEELCDNLRDNDIMLYTVGVQVDTRTQGILQNCATEGDMFFNVSNTAGIATAFDRIAGSIENLRIAR